jgi:hypothetical protein
LVVAGNTRNIMGIAEPLATLGYIFAIFNATSNSCARKIPGPNMGS